MTIEERILQLKGAEVSRYYQQIDKMKREVELSIIKTKFVREEKSGMIVGVKKTEAEIEKEIKDKITDKEKQIAENSNEYLNLLANLENFILNIDKIIKKEKIDLWHKIVFDAFSSYTEGNPLENEKISCVIRAGKVLKWINEKGTIDASKLLKANESKTLWDYDTKIIIKLGGEAGKECYKYSERYRNKIENSSSRDLEELDRVLG